MHLVSNSTSISGIRPSAPRGNEEITWNWKTQGFATFLHLLEEPGLQLVPRPQREKLCQGDKTLEMQELLVDLIGFWL